jgi:hypothetical protein
VKQVVEQMVFVAIFIYFHGDNVNLTSFEKKARYLRLARNHRAKPELQGSREWQMLLECSFGFV